MRRGSRRRCKQKLVLAGSTHGEGGIHLSSTRCSCFLSNEKFPATNNQTPQPRSVIITVCLKSPWFLQYLALLWCTLRDPFTNLAPGSSSSRAQQRSLWRVLDATGARFNPRRASLARCKGVALEWRSQIICSRISTQNKSNQP